VLKNFFAPKNNGTDDFVPLSLDDFRFFISKKLIQRRTRDFSLFTRKTISLIRHLFFSKNVVKLDKTERRSFKVTGYSPLYEVPLKTDLESEDSRKLLGFAF